MKAGKDIKIRNLDVVVVDKINDLAKKKGMSREEYLRGLLGSMAILDEVKECEDRYSRLVDLVCQSIQDTQKILIRILDKLENG